jgi:CRP-like cAMP-binding protein
VFWRPEKLLPTIPASSLPEFHLAPTAPEIRVRVTDRPSRINNLPEPKELDAFRDISTFVAHRRSGVEIFSEGEDAHFVYAIDQGVVRLVRHAENGKRQILAFIMPGDLFGWPEEGAYSNAAETVSAVRLYRAPWDRLVQRMLEVPQLQLNLLARVAHDLHQAQRWMTILAQQSTTQRLASLLLDFLRHPEFYDERRGYLHLPINRSDLADYLGIARETAVRAVTTLESKGTLRRVGPKTIQILDIAGLRAMKPVRRRALGTDAESRPLKVA